MPSSGVIRCHDGAAFTLFSRRRACHAAACRSRRLRHAFTPLLGRNSFTSLSSLRAFLRHFEIVFRFTLSPRFFAVRIIFVFFSERLSPLVTTRHIFTTPHVSQLYICSLSLPLLKHQVPIIHRAILHFPLAYCLRLAIRHYRHRETVSPSRRENEETWSMKRGIDTACTSSLPPGHGTRPGRWAM